MWQVWYRNASEIKREHPAVTYLMLRSHGIASGNPIEVNVLAGGRYVERLEHLQLLVVDVLDLEATAMDQPRTVFELKPKPNGTMRIPAVHEVDERSAERHAFDLEVQRCHASSRQRMAQQQRQPCKHALAAAVAPDEQRERTDLEVLALGEALVALDGEVGQVHGSGLTVEDTVSLPRACGTPGMPGRDDPLCFLPSSEHCGPCGRLRGRVLRMIQLRFASPLLSAVLASLALSCSDDGLAGQADGEIAGGTTAEVASSSGSGDRGDASLGGDSSGASETSPADSAGAATVEVSGDAFAFTLPGTPYGLIDGATISILEQPDQTTQTDAMGHYVLPAVPAGSEATLVIEAEGFPLARTKTFTIPDSGTLERVTFQVPDDTLFAALASLLVIEVDPAACQIVSTVTRVGKSIYDAGAHGEAGATVTLEPAIPPEHGPVYFGADVIPDRSLTETSEDGGVLYTNVPVGTYVMRAHKDGVVFEETTMKCEAGVLVNASPPYGLQAL